MVIGVGFYSFTIGNLASIFNSIDIKAAHLHQKLAILAEFSKRTRLSEDVQNRVKRFLENNHMDHLAMYDQKQLLSEVPACLRSEVVSHTHEEIIHRIKFFEEKSPPFLFAILPLLKPMKLYPKDTLYCQNDYAEEVFFIYKGRIKMYFDLNHAQQHATSVNIPFNLYVEGSYFGDSDLFIGEGRNVRDCTAISVFESSLLVITRRELFDLFYRFKAIKNEMADVGKERAVHHLRLIKEAREKYFKELEREAVGELGMVDSINTEELSFFNSFKKTFKGVKATNNLNNYSMKVAKQKTH
jgi:Cyclic nucleotide-binding domain